MPIERAAGSGLPPLIGVDGAVLTEHPIGTAAWVPPAFLITSFGCAPTQSEIGQAVGPVNFAAAYNRPASTVTVDDGSGPVIVPLPGVAFVLPGPYVKTGINAAQSFALLATQGSSSASAGTGIAFLPRVYWGTAPVPVAYDQAFIVGLASNTLAAARQRLMAVNATPGQKIYYCFPTVYGGVPGNFIDNDTGFAAGFTKIAPGVLVTNAFGVVVSIDVWESNQFGLGAVNIRVT